MDNLLRALILSLFVFLPASANSWVPKWVDGPAPATYERTPMALRTYVDLPKYGGHAVYTLDSSPSIAGAGSYIGPASTATTPKISTNVKIPLGTAAGAAAFATLTAVIPKLNLAKAAVAMVRLNPYLSTALTVGWLANAGYQYFKDTDTFTQSPPPVVASNANYNFNSYGCGPTFTSSSSLYTCIKAAAGPKANCDGSYPGWFPNTVSETSTLLQFSVCPAYQIISATKTATTTCPTGYTYSGGQCNVNPGNTTPVTSSQVETGLTAAPVSGTNDTASGLNGVLGETVQNGFNPDTDGATPTLTGSTSPVQGPKQTTTSPDGTVTTTNTSYTPSYTNNYSDIAETTVTTVTDNSNTTTTKTTTGPADTPAQVQQQTDCDKHPDNIGCAKFGDIPVKDTIPLTNVSMSLTPSSLGAGSCPAPVVLTLHGQPNITLSYQRYCDFASMLSPFIVSLAYLSAGLIVIGSIREA